jgi:hypothetical protein
MALKSIINRVENKARYPSGKIGSSKSLSVAFVGIPTSASLQNGQIVMSQNRPT